MLKDKEVFTLMSKELKKNSKYYNLPKLNLVFQTEEAWEQLFKQTGYLGMLDFERVLPEEYKVMLNDNVFTVA